MSSGLTLDALLRELAREAATECAAALRRDLRQALAEERARQLPAGAGADVGYVSVKEAAKIAGVHESTIRGWLKDAKLRAYQPEPRILRVRIDELHAVMAGRQRAGNADVIDLDARVRELSARAAKFNSRR